MKFKYILSLLFLAFCLAAAAQEQPLSPEEQKKQLLEDIDTQVEKMTDNLNLEDWQVFYVDSILVHDYSAMQDEIRTMSASKVSNPELYYRVQDKWSEKIYQAYKKIFNEEQWAKYLKQGGQRDKKARDKREAKRNK